MTSNRSSFRRLAASLAYVTRSAWLIGGATLALLLLIESVYRLQRATATALASPDKSRPTEPPNPFDSSSWARDYWIGHHAEEKVQWASYVYVRNPTFRARHAEVDSLGHRVTPVSSAPAGARPVRIFFIGGSTTFGWFQRAEHTIPAEAARRLQEMPGTSARLEPTNLGVPGRIFAQDIIELVNQLRAGARPDVVMFYDGINDVAAMVQNGKAGIPQNEANRVEDFDRGRRLVAESRPGFANDLRSLLHLGGGVLNRLQFVQRLTERRTSGSVASLVNVDSAAQGIARMYAANVQVVEALAARFGFRAIYVWQPALFSTNKRLTARERWLLRPVERDPKIQRIRDVQRAVPQELRAAVVPLVGARFVDVTHLFDGDTLEVFVDLYGHTYERVNPRVIDSIMPQLSAAILQPPFRAHSPP